ncbi:MAG: hypothetical protein JW736_07855 [Deltaproteobacteria bacterium]|nr:hypothetical protein [Deltaproteobacteria bacterium]MBN2687325.1 hypothetical protein [Deltaproteobacteria bacterium]
MVEFSQLRPGAKADVVIAVDYIKEKIDVRRSLIYDVIDDNIILSQTSPPVSSHYVGTRVVVTYLVRKDNEYIRYGYEGTVAEIIRNYRLTSSEKVSAFVVRIKGYPARFNVRMHFRVRPGSASGLTLTISGEKMAIIDISIGGAKVTHRMNMNIETKTRVRGILCIDSDEYTVEALVLRKWRQEQSKRRQGIEYLAIRFMYLSSAVENHLAKKIREIERENRSKELGLTARDSSD